MAGEELTLSRIRHRSSGLTDGPPSCELPHRGPLIRIHLEGRALKGSEIPGDFVSFIPFTYLKKYLLRACVQKLREAGILAGQDQRGLLLPGNLKSELSLWEDDGVSA